TEIFASRCSGSRHKPLSSLSSKRRGAIGACAGKGCSAGCSVSGVIRPAVELDQQSFATGAADADGDRKVESQNARCVRLARSRKTMTTYFVTRHSGAIEWLRQEGVEARI